MNDRRHTGGFTLVEIMVTASILSLGLVMIFRSFFTALDAAAHAADRLNISLDTANRIWQSEESLRRSGSVDLPRSGTAVVGTGSYPWDLKVEALNEALGFYKITISHTVTGAARKFSVERSAYISP
ncbi:MAG: prepilin-type N-terminal cleavage/methylation domain-containing protein [Candidatus Omnitrophota bacterium]